MKNLLIPNTLIWFGLFVLGFTNGTLRELGIKKFIGEPWAHHLSCFTGILIFSTFIWLIWDKTQIQSSKQAFAVGAYWFILTVLTETFVLNRMMSKLTWEQILQTYNLAAGELWILVLLWVGIMPAVIFHIKQALRS